MPIYTALTAGGLMLRLAHALGDLLHTGTTTAGSTTTYTDNTQPETADNDERVAGNWWYGISGTAAGQERVLTTTYTGSTGVGTFQRAGTSPAADTGYIRTRQYRPTDILRALQDAQRYQAQRLLTYLPVVGREIVLGSAIPNNFDLFTTNPPTSANPPDGLAVDANSTFSVLTATGMAPHGMRRSLRMVTDGTNAGSVRYTAPRSGRWRGKTAQLYVLLRSSIAARTTIEINDGTGTATTSTMTTNSRWEWLTVSRSVNEAATQVRFSVEVSAGAAVTVDMSYWYAPEPESNYHSYSIDADRNLIAIGGLRVSGPVSSESTNQGYIFGDGPTIDDGAWGIFEDADDTPRQLRLSIGSGWNGRVLEYTGLARHAELTGPTISYTGTPELIIPRAKYFLLNGTETPNASGQRPLTRAALEEAEAAEGWLGLRVPYGYKRVQRQ